MEQQLKSKLKSIVIEIRHLLEGYHDKAGTWFPGDLELKLITLGIRKNDTTKDINGLEEIDIKAREIALAFIENIIDSGGNQEDAITEFIRETAYTWANRLIALRCMEARSIIDEVILQKANYGGRSLQHHRMIQKNPELSSTSDDGLYHVLFTEFNERAKELPSLFDNNSIKIALRPNVSAIQKCIEMLSAPDEIFSAPDALGWAYQYWNTEEKDRVFERVKTVKNAKIEKLDIIPATQLYTEPYMVKFLVQNSLGATWMQMNPHSKLSDNWEYYVKDADRAQLKKKSIKEISFLDPCVGSGHFHLEAFDLFYSMYLEEGYSNPSDICQSIFENNLYGIDIDERAIQISAASLYMKAKEIAPDFIPTAINLVATNIHLSHEKDHIEEYLAKYPEDKPLRNALEIIFDSLKHADELGSLLQIEEPVDKELKFLKSKEEDEKAYIDEKLQDTLFKVTTLQGHLPLNVESYDEWKRKVITNLRKHFERETKEQNISAKLFGEGIGKGLTLFDFLSKKYDIVATNPPYMYKRNMGENLRRICLETFNESGNDLYSSLILRSIKLLNKTGKLAFCVQQTFMFLSTYLSLRNELINKTPPNIITHLGTRSFEEISGAKVSTVLLITDSNSNRKCLFYDLRLISNIQKKIDFLKYSKEVYKIHEIDKFNKIPGSPWSHWLTDYAIECFEKWENLLDKAIPKQGMATGNNSRFLRFWWENKLDYLKWPIYLKGGKSTKYYGNLELRLDYRISAHEWYSTSPSARYRRGHEFYFTEGITYTLQSELGFSGRYIPNKCVFDIGGSCIFPIKNDSLFPLIGYLNSRLTDYFLQSLNPTLSYQIGDLKRLPIPDISNEQISNLTKLVFSIRKELIGNNLSNHEYANYGCNLQFNYLDIFKLELIESLIVHYIDSYYFSMIQFQMQDNNYPLIRDYDFINFPLNESISELLSTIQNTLTSNFSKSDILKIKNNLRILFEKGRSNQSNIENLEYDIIEEDTISESDDDSIIINDNLGSIKPVPAETFLEELSQKMEINPISIYWLLKEGIEKEGWRSIPEERKYTLDRFTFYILRLLGHKWPLQIEANEPCPAWADEDGIIPISQDTDEVTLYDRLRERIAEDFGESNLTKEENYFNEIGRAHV